MTPFYEDELAAVYLGDCLTVLREMPDASVDAVVTDPPGAIAFMGRSWDTFTRERFIEFMTDRMGQCLRVLKPGGHALVWAIPRTSHWTGAAIEEAGFEVRDFVCHHFGSGWPKSGTALKPATEIWWLARKPLSEPSLAAQVLGTGTGALNIDACRVPATSKGDFPSTKKSGAVYAQDGYSKEWRGKGEDSNPSGRWPANLVLTCCGEEPHAPGCPAAELDLQSGTLSSGSRQAGVRKGLGYHGSQGDGGPAIEASSGGASRFFYTAKASARERNEGLPEGTRNGHVSVKAIALMRYLCRLITPPGGIVCDPFCGSGSTGVAAVREGFRFIGIEKDEESCGVAVARIRHAVEQVAKVEQPAGQAALFDLTEAAG